MPAIAADILERLRERRPRVHCITNAVAQNFTANMLLAVGAVPSMTIAPKEVKAFAARADALLVNLGTFDPERQKASLAAVGVGQQGRHSLGARSGVHRPLAAARGLRQDARRARSPRALRLNRAEFGALSGGQDRTTRRWRALPRRGARWSA